MALDTNAVLKQSLDLWSKSLTNEPSIWPSTSHYFISGKKKKKRKENVLQTPSVLALVFITPTYGVTVSLFKPVSQIDISSNQHTIVPSVGYVSLTLHVHHKITLNDLLWQIYENVRGLCWNNSKNVLRSQMNLFPMIAKQIHLGICRHWSGLHGNRACRSGSGDLWWGYGTVHTRCCSHRCCGHYTGMLWGK